jgi:hypothetical protein
MDNLKTLAEIWTEADRKPIDVLHLWKESQEIPYRLVGVDGKKALAIFGDDSQITALNCHNRAWTLHKEKKLVKYWPAIYEAEKGYYYISNDIFPTEIMAK